MIVHISGMLSEVAEDRVVLDREGVGREVLVCGYTAQELSSMLGQQTTLYTMEYLEGNAAGGNLVPRMVGFLRPEDRAFFNRFITVKGMGVRKAIKALAQPVGQVAAAIEEGDELALGRLPGVGKRGASQIVAELRGKMTPFAVTRVAIDTVEDWTAEQRDALDVLIALGERRADGARWLSRARQLHPETRGSDEWVRLAYRIRTSEG